MLGSEYAKNRDLLVSLEPDGRYFTISAANFGTGACVCCNHI